MEPVLLAWPLATLDDAARANAGAFLDLARSGGRAFRTLFAADGEAGFVAQVRELAVNLDVDAIVECLIKPEGERDPSYNRTRILLVGAGSRIIMTDGDIACRPARLPSFADEAAGPVYEGPRYSVPTTVHPDREAALSAVEPIDIDVIGEHLKYLGASTDVLFPGAEKPRGVVFMTSPGTYGDSGFSLARGALTLEGEPRDALHACGYERCKLSRETVRMPERDVVSPSLQFLGMQAGYDAREYAPPFLPVGRNQDGLYALLARVLLPGSLTAYPAFGLYHDPIEPRAYDPATLTSFAPNRADIFMAFAARLCPPSSMTDPCERTIALGSRFRETSGLSASDLVDLAHGGLANAALAHAERLEELLDRYGREPASWARDVDAHLENVYGFLRESATVFGPNGSARSISAVRSDLDRFGRFLSVWPELFERAKEMNREGRGIAQSLEK